MGEYAKFFKEKENKKPKTAVALSYDVSDSAPKIVATGHGYVAEKIVETAKESNVPVHKDEKLAHTLSKLEIGDYIPPELYDVVAEILAFVDDCERIKGKLNV